MSSIYSSSSDNEHVDTNQQWSKVTGKDGKLIKHFQSNAHIADHERLTMFKKDDTHVDIQLDKGKFA